MESYIDLLFRCYPLLIQGTLTTLQVFLAAGSVSFSLGLILGLLLSHRLKLPIISPIIEVICFIYRAIPFFVQLLIVYFVLPDLLGWSFDPFQASVIALGMCSAGYVAQIVRSGINSIPSAQWESAFTLGYNTVHSVRYIILPQMVRHMLPTLVNELDALLKSTAITASIGMLELTRVGMNVVSREMEPVAIYLTIALIYVCISSVINLISKFLERRLAYAKY